MYAILMADDEEKKRAKGVRRDVIKRDLTFQKYVETIRMVKVSSFSQTLIRSQRHRIYTISNLKKCLSPFDDKRYLLSDGITSVPYGFVDK